jgi:hypothetical protein
MQGFEDAKQTNKQTQRSKYWRTSKSNKNATARELENFVKFCLLKKIVKE